MISELDAFNMINNPNRHKQSSIIKYLHNSSLKSKIKFLINEYKFEKNTILLGLSYVKMCDKVNIHNIHLYTLCAIILANKYLNDYNIDILNILKSIEITIDDYKNIELNLLNSTNWKLDEENDEIKHQLVKRWK
jgi:hypothetical protein